MKGRLLIIILFLFPQLLTKCQQLPGDRSITAHGALIRTDTTSRQIHLVFTGHEFSDGYKIIKPVLDKSSVKAHFFLTGEFYRNPNHSTLIKELSAAGHYLGAHSDRHLLYCSWENRDSLLVTKSTFVKDFLNNYAEMQRFGISAPDARYFMPPYEWYNDSISLWTNELGHVLINFTPGTLSHTDWTYPDLGGAYRSSDEILKSILQYEADFGLNGFILLLHVGTDPRRVDKFYSKLDFLITELISRGYDFSLLTDLHGS